MEALEKAIRTRAIPPGHPQSHGSTECMNKVLDFAHGGVRAHLQAAVLDRDREHAQAEDKPLSDAEVITARVYWDGVKDLIKAVPRIRTEGKRAGWCPNTILNITAGGIWPGWASDKLCQA